MPLSRTQTRTRTHPSDNDESAEESLAVTGRQLTRMIDMFWCPIEVLTLGKQVHQMSGQSLLTFREKATAQQKRALALLDKLNELDPGLIPRLIESGSHAGVLTRDAKRQLKTGQSNGKSEDMRKVKMLLGEWRTWDPPLPSADHKSQRGLNHIQCAYLLSDPLIDWEDLEARTQFVSYSRPPMNSSAWARYLRPFGQYNPDRPSDGLLKGELMIKAAEAILFSPAASKTTRPSTTTGARGHQRTAIGVSKSYQLTKVTPAFIAYVAVVTKHSKTVAGFDYIDFYEQIRQYLESTKFVRSSALLLDWWNRQLFPEYRLGETPLPVDHRLIGTLASLEAEMEAEDLNQEEEEGAEEEGALT